MANDDNRQAWINGLRELATWLESHPDIEVPTYIRYRDRRIRRHQGASGRFARKADQWRKELLRPIRGPDQGLRDTHLPSRYPSATGSSKRSSPANGIVEATPEHEVDTYEWKCTDAVLSKL